ncbi:hypothetical protein [Undibacterium sp. TS12]|uniref:hypothetical protein n=1 Tax=Undibacterium sp. TS12 TaxID=2908202 RepID=UPI001F4C9409|nr:hypothetical protein [Undibacterium sp. TS12]MCH8621061.1 hypothetical protein [Undibacterium sp. TS12]
MMKLVSILIFFLSMPLAAASAAESNDSIAAWQQVEKVLLHPRCLNCHSAGDSPRQADDRHVHQFRVFNGHEGKGKPGALCIGCHQTSNQTSGVPGASNWQHAPASMTWESSPGIAMKGRQLCQSLRDPKKNGDRNLAALVEHLRTEPLVLWAWSPGKNARGEARTTPPLSHEELISYASLWSNTGGKCPP